MRLDLTGRTFGKLKANRIAGKDKRGNMLWECECQCDQKTIVNVPATRLTTGKTRSCGCIAKSHGLQLAGKKFGMLTAIRRAGKQKDGSIVWDCKCDCGKTTQVRSSTLASGNIKSCGCMQIDSVSTHGMTKTRLYNEWTAIKRRCSTDSLPTAKRYKNRGITVCEEWLNSFEAFRDWALDNGYRDDLTIDRIDNDGNYEPGNCRWATTKQQGLNRSSNVCLTLNNKTMTITEWAEIVSVDRATLYSRVKRGWSAEKALTTKTMTQFCRTKN